ncbi:MAG: hypothetical protein AMJ69_07770 [Gammaproteobacteria bacterium SG8_47]|nr:MAG: hypothetical protein AMJ69_07770 [Gammaproteobacteria bacterium SG8_47]
MLDLELHPSWSLTGALGGVHLAAMLALVQPIALPVGLRLIVAAIVAASAILTLRRWALLRSPRSLIRLRGSASGEWRVITAAGEAYQARLGADAVVTNGLVIMHLECADGRTRHAVICRDSIGTENLRRLRRVLRTQRVVEQR